MEQCYESNQERLSVEVQGHLDAEKPSLGGNMNYSKEMEEQEITRYTWEKNCSCGTSF